MDELIYSNRLSGVPSLYVSTGADDTCWSAFLTEDVPISRPSHIRFSETVGYRGYYLFAARRPSDCARLVGRLLPHLFPLDEGQWGGIVWLADADGKIDGRNMTRMLLQEYDRSFILMSAFNLHMGNDFATLTVTPLANMQVELDGTNNRFVLSRISIVFNTNGQMRMEADKRLEIPACGRLGGSIRFLAELNGNFSCFKSLDTAFKYFYPDADNPGHACELSCPVFRDTAYGNIEFQLSMNPVDLLNKDRLTTYIAFLGTSKASTVNTNGIPTVLQSYFRSDYGLPVDLAPEPCFTECDGNKNVPLEGCAMLVFSERKCGSAEHRWYMVPSGRFRMLVGRNATVPVPDDRIRFLCGLSGTETVGVSLGSENGGGDYLVFKEGEAAYVPYFPIREDAGKPLGSANVQEMDGSYRTAWIGFQRGNGNSKPVVYHSQPQGNALFRISEKEDGGDSRAFMDFYPGNTGCLDNAGTAVFFPMLAYGPEVVTPPRTDLAGFEAQVMVPFRKKCVERALKGQIEERLSRYMRLCRRNDDTASVDSVTPQGFHVRISEETHVWEQVRLAGNRYRKGDGTFSPIYTFEFRNLGTALQNALQTNELFLVVSSDRHGVLGDFMNEMHMDGWPFIVDVPGAEAPSWNNGRYENVLIFKYCEQTLLERVRDIRLWTNPEEFNDASLNGLANLSDWLSDYIEDGIGKYEQQHDADFYKFYRIATDPSWKGVIALKVNISLTTFPEELRGLLAGIDLDGFHAHHFGIEASTVKLDGNGAGMSPNSSMFGLINYEDTIFRQYGSDVDAYKAGVIINTAVDYEFRVLLLKVVFANSRITAFNSYIAFTVNRLFGEKVKDGNRENLLVLTGTYEREDEVPSYTFHVEGSNRMEVDSPVLRSVSMVKTDFVTAVSPGKGTTKNVKAVFSFSGNIDFHALEGFDLLSFGNEDGCPDDGNGLAFLNMRVNLAFPLDSPTEQTYVFDAGQMSFDPETSYTRSGSLYSHFPLQFTGIVSGTKDDTPENREYLSVELPSLKQRQAVSDVWYGLEFRLDMGTPGALADKMGFNAGFLAAWNVGGTGAVAGLKLPGTNPKIPILNIQGIIKLSIKTVSLDIADDGVSYLMRLNDIALKFLTLSFPDKGRMGFFLFGNPTGKGATESSLGWYGGYRKKKHGREKEQEALPSKNS